MQTLLTLIAFEAASEHDSHVTAYELENPFLCMVYDSAEKLRPVNIFHRASWMRGAQLAAQLGKKGFWVDVFNTLEQDYYGGHELVRSCSPDEFKMPRY
jgi:hypothetical protein